MADEKIGISIEVKGTGAGIKSVKELKDEVKKLDETINKSDFGSEEYKKATEEANKLKAKMTELSGTESTKMVTSLKGLQQEYKRLKVALSEASNPQDFSRLSAELNDVEGKIGDMNDAASLATGSGVEQLQKGMSLVGEGLRNFDFEKIKIGFKGIGNAMSAAAPLLLVSAIAALIENFDAVKAVIVQVIPALDSTSKATHDLEKEQKKLVETNKLAVVALENELRILEASGASQEKILAKKKELIAVKIKELEGDNALQKSKLTDIQQNDTLLEGYDKIYIALLRKTGQDAQADIYEKALQASKLDRAKEFSDKIKENEIAISKLKTDLVVEQINNDKKVTESAKKSSEDRKKQAEIDGEARYNSWKAEQERMANEEAIIIPEQKEAIAQTELEINAAKNAELLNQSALAYEQDTANYKKAQEEKHKQNEILSKLSFDAAKGLSDAVFAIQLAGLKKGSAEELAVRKKAFQVDKAFAIAKATMDGYKAVLSTYAETPGGIVIKTIAASLAGVFAGANIAKIAASKFDGGGSASAGGSISTPTAGTTSLPTPPTINTPQNNTNTQFDANGNTLRQSNQTQTIDITGKIMLSENEVREKTNRANKLITQTTI